MIRFSSVVVLFLIAGVSFCAKPENNGVRVRVPVLLELFTSEGCSSCPPADRLLEALDRTQPVAGAEVIVLSEHVDYWNRLGWTDPFSSPEYSTRQYGYASKFHLDSVYTPQLVLDGRVQLVGSDGYGVVSAIENELRQPKIAIAISNALHSENQVAAHLELAPAEPQNGIGTAILYVALAENKTESQVARGENAGRSLEHVAVVRALRQVSRINLDGPFATEVTFGTPPGVGTNGLRLVAFLQDPGSGHVLGVALQRLQ
jgi:hypothetical protein